ncbi:lipid-A-disaccharide synthase [Cardinium endosymbiont of Bemisia tabaci]|uniref:lipid-A-disaccharide synthase n=1 Tax=Cardinium endosymbiont of Bemisia tabaci TaxID=672794 RepID=UPI000442D35A|nr:lipid-A-disaccharide synthase [Cardinium endosymbiont of Bemisia tabaci]CDG49872.1 Lipid-A-disaccharide synthase [Cardinium endosymbiont cBtQ1 of Bemisia tabaci]
MRYYVIAGEHSGDMHGADLIRQIKLIDHHADFWSCGGEAMSKAMGKPCSVDGSKIAYMGIDFLKKWYTLWQLLKFCKKSLKHYQPAVVVLIDYSGFNMRLAAFAKKNGFLVHYYIPPKIWAHGPKRITKIKWNVDQVWSILPFEVAYYQGKGYHTIDYVGNPLVQKVGDHRINPSFIADNRLDHRPIIALFPGSRLDEIQRLLPLMVAQAAYFKGYQFVVAGLSVVPSSLYQALCPPTVQVIYDQTYDLMAVAKVAIIAAGTASLEAALFNLAQIVVYKLHPLAYFFYKSIITVEHISLVNLLMNQPIVPELIQYQLTDKKLHVTLTNLLSGNGKAKQQAAYPTIRRLLGPQHAAATVARHILVQIKQHLQNQKNDGKKTR